MSVAARSTLSAWLCAKIPGGMRRESRSAATIIIFLFFKKNFFRLQSGRNFAVDSMAMENDYASEFSLRRLTACHQGGLIDIFLLDNALSFFDRQQLVRIHVGNSVNHAARPADFDEVYLRPLFQAEMQPRVALRDVTRAAPHFVYLRQIAGDDFDLGADAVAVALDADRPDRHEVIRVAAVVPQQLRRAVQIVDDNVNIAVIIQIAESHTTPRAQLHQRRAGL